MNKNNQYKFENVLSSRPQNGIWNQTVNTDVEQNGKHLGIQISEKMVNKESQMPNEILKYVIAIQLFFKIIDTDYCNYKIR